MANNWMAGKKPGAAKGKHMGKGVKGYVAGALAPAKTFSKFKH